MNGGREEAYQIYILSYLLVCVESRAHRPAEGRERACNSTPHMLVEKAVRPLFIVLVSHQPPTPIPKLSAGAIISIVHAC